MRIEIADSVDKDVVSGAISAQCEIVTGRYPAFAGGDRQTGNVAKNIGQARRALLRDYRLWDDCDRLWKVTQGFGITW